MALVTVERGRTVQQGEQTRFSAIALAAYVASVPLLLPNVDVLHRLPLGDGVLVALGASPFLRSFALAALFAALVMLFVCLIKTAYGRLGTRFVVVAACAYVLGAALGVFGAPLLFEMVVLQYVAGALLGFGAAVLGMAWTVQVRLGDYRVVLRNLIALAAGAVVVDGVLITLPSQVVGPTWCVVAAVGAVGCVIGFRREAAVRRGATLPGSNWWDVFGALDVSLVEGARDFAPARILFFVVAPSVMLLLLVLAMDLHHTPSADGFPLEEVGSLLAVACALPLLVIKTDRTTMNFAYRLYLPAVVTVVFIAGNFGAAEVHSTILGVGIFAFCMLYALLMTSMVLTMAGRMPSLRLPAACLIVLAAGLLVLLSYTPVDAGSLNQFKFPMLMVLLVSALALLVFMPGARIWSIVFDTTSHAQGEPASSAPTVALTLEERCGAVADQCGLTPRESEILRFLGRGYGSAYVANELVVAESTVRSHVKSIYRKTGVSSREELIALIDAVDPAAASTDDEPLSVADERMPISSDDDIAPVLPRH